MLVCCVVITIKGHCSVECQDFYQNTNIAVFNCRINQI